MLKLGSLFDGSGTCPLAATLCGIEPVWASEIEKFPIEVTTKRFPNMKHLGDITKINGAEIEPVDIITFGSPCQDLSIAGKREGLEGKRSSLFMEAIRIIREMREKTNGKYPRFIIWENVPGTFSSNKGYDFRTMLEEIAETEIPMPDSGKWATAGMVELQERQIVWRVLDAQFWGVPQRRRRIFLVADFDGKCATEVLFKPESVSGYFTQGRETREGITENIEGSVDEASGFGESGIGYRQSGIQTLRAEGENRPSRPSNVIVSTIGYDRYNQKITGDVMPTIKAVQGGDDINCVFEMIVRDDDLSCISGNTVPSIVTYPDIVGTLCASGAGLNRAAGQGNEIDFCIVQAKAINQNADGEVRESDVAYTINTNSNPSGRNAPLVYGFCPDNSITAGGVACEEEKSTTLSTTKRLGVAYGIGNGQVNQSLDYEKIGLLNCMHDQQAVMVNSEIEQREFYLNGIGSYKEGSGTLRAQGGDCGGGSETLYCENDKKSNHIVRRLTPTECARLQGFPDWWCSDIPHSDTAEYKMWGNGMALPCVLYIMKNIADVIGT